MIALRELLFSESVSRFSLETLQIALWVLLGLGVITAVLTVICTVYFAKTKKNFPKVLLLIFAYLCLLLTVALIAFCFMRYNQAAVQLAQPTEPSTVPTAAPTEATTVPTEPPTEPTEPEPTEFNVTLSFVGDCMLASYCDETTESNFNGHVNSNEPTYFLDNVRHIFEADDFTVVNLENVFTDQSLGAVDKGYTPAYWFKSKTSNTEILTSSGVEGVSLSNNHVNDYGEAGYLDTVEAVTNAGLAYGADDQIMYFEKEGFTVAVICTGLWYEGQSNQIINWLEEAEEQSDYQVVFFHGGEEKLHSPEDWKVREAHKLVDNGADLVLGNHPHVLQPREIYNGVEIIYSLGNFCYGGARNPENRTIIYQMNLVIDIETLTVADSESTIIPCYVFTGKTNNYQPAIIENKDEIQTVLDFMDGLVDSPL